MYYNRDVFRSLHVPEPKAGWTWTDMRQAAIRLTRDTDGDGRNELYGLGVEPTLIRIAPFVWSNGGDLVDDEERPTRLTLDSPEALAVLRDFLALRTQFGVVPTDEEVEAEDDEARFMNSRLAMILQSRRSAPAFRTIKTFDWDVAPLPRFQKPAGILHSDAYCMTRASRHKDAAWRFMAEVEDADSLFVFTRITLPLMTPVLLLLLARDTILSFQTTFVPALIVTEGGPPPYATTYLPLFVYRTAFEYLRYGYAAAATLTMFVLTAAIVVVQWRIVRRWRRPFVV